jgi:hypothetical protein
MYPEGVNPMAIIIQTPQCVELGTINMEQQTAEYRIEYKEHKAVGKRDTPKGDRLEIMLQIIQRPTVAYVAVVTIPQLTDAPT